MNRPHADLPEFAAEALGPGDPEAERATAEALALVSLALEPLATSSEARARLLAEAGARSWGGFHQAMARLFDLSGAAVRELVRRARDASQWQPGPIAGVDLFHLEGGPRLVLADCGLVRLAPGTAFPHHRHVGTEVSLILEGSLIESTGRVFHPGDLHELGKDSEHSFRISDDGPCVFAVVLSAGIEIPGVGLVTGRR